MTFKMIDLFAGIGGIRLGFEKSFKNNIECVFTSEIDKYARKTYSSNFNDNYAISGDITKIKESIIPKHDILLAGFPCQPFSLAEKRKGLNDSRGLMINEIFRIVKYHNPRIVFLENTKQFYYFNKNQIFNDVIREFNRIGYISAYVILNSKNFGLPQNRERLFIVNFRDKDDIKDFHINTTNHKKACIRDIIENNPVNEKYYLSERYLDCLFKHKERMLKKKSNFGYCIRDLTEITGTLTASASGRENNLIIDTRTKQNKNKLSVRTLTPFEFAKCQGFDENFIMPCSDSQLYKQFGNSVSIPVIESIADNIKQVIL